MFIVCLHLLGCKLHWGKGICLVYSLGVPSAYIFVGYICRSEIAGSYGDFVFNILGRARLFSKVAAPLYIPTSSVRVLVSPHPH